MDGRLAAAMAWPWRFSFSSGMWKRMRSATSGNSAARTSVAIERIRSPPAPGQHAAEHQQIAHLVEIGVGGDVVAEVDADGLVDPAGARSSPAAISFCTCSSLTGSGISVGRSIPAGASSRSDGLLREVLRAHAAVAGPFVRRGVLAIIHRHEGEFVQPRRDRALRRDVAGGQAAAHGDAEHGAIVERHRAGERGDFAIVHHVERNAAPGLLQVEEQPAHARVEERSRGTER